MIQRHVIVDLGSLADHHTHAMIDKKSPPDGRSRVDFNTSQPAPNMRQKTRQPFEIGSPQAMRHAMKNACVQTRVAGNDLKHTACRRIARKYAVYILFNGLEHLALALL